MTLLFLFSLAVSLILGPYNLENSVSNLITSQLINKNVLSVTTSSDNSVTTADVTASQNMVTEEQLSEVDDYAAPQPTPSIAPADAQIKYSAQVSTIDSTTSPNAAVSAKPNIVVIMLDDLPLIDGRLYGQKRMPNLYSTVVSKGITFNNFFGNSPLCCPGRANVLTGQFTHNHEVTTNDANKFHPSKTIATELQDVGYYTMLYGKYFNRYNYISTSKAVPPGWNRFYGEYEENGKFYDYRLLDQNGNLHYYGWNSTDYSTDVITNLAIRDMKNVPTNKPVFMYLAVTAAHTPNTPAPRHLSSARCNGVGRWNPPSYNESDVSDKPWYIRSLPQVTPSNGYGLVTTCRTLLSVDDMVGRVKNELQRQGRLSNTVFVFTSDNGMAWGEHRWLTKTVPYSTQLPLYIAWPSGMGTNAKANSTLLSNVDLAPTFCELAGCSMGPYWNGQQKADGISFANILKNKATTVERNAILEEMTPYDPTKTGRAAATARRPYWYAIRTAVNNPLGLWHYIEVGTGEKELYDISKGPCFRWSSSKGGDPCELKNLLGPGTDPSQNVKNIRNALAAQLATLKAQKGYVAPTPTPTPTTTP